MNPDQLLEAFAAGELTLEETKRKLLGFTSVDVGCAKLDHHRAARTGCPEVVYCEGKTPEQTAEIMRELVEHNGCALGTRSTQAHLEAATKLVPASRDEVSRLLVAGEPPAPKLGKVVVVTGGATDEPVAEEAAGTLEFLGSRVVRRYDCGVAGMHRLFGVMNEFEDASVIVAVAGMEGALPSVVGGLAAPPVVAVPTSVGYGANFGGLSALLTMLNTCAPGIGVVNIDNGFGGGYLAHKINVQTVGAG